MDHATTAPAPPVTGHTKQYVFVDEYNRHKRLKVMRACDGCRKRKIRCDGALQNGPWPCGACVRLKLKCVPPTLDQDDDQETPSGLPGQTTFSFQNTTFPNTSPAATKGNGFPPQPPMVQEWPSSTPAPTMTPTPTSAPSLPHDFDPSGYSYSQQPYHQQPAPRLASAYGDDPYFNSASVQYQPSYQSPSLTRTQTVDSRSSSGDPEEIDAGVQQLSAQMGDLQIDITSAAPYITNQKIAPDAPAIEEEAEVVLPQSVYTDSTVRIPPEMMPDEKQAMDYFGYFFEHVHPYVPVLHRASFYQQWRNARATISPLLLEGIFACVTRYSAPIAESRRWLALASRHEESFKDVPRLSTIQAMIILMKARESISKRGYYYRSWMAVKYMTTMGFDLSLHEHNDKHRMEHSCDLDRQDCIVRTRVWQTLFLLEILVGAPQGRTDFAVDAETVQLDPPLSASDIDAYEHKTSRRSGFMAQNVANIKQSNLLWQHMRRYKKDWALDPVFTRHNEDLPNWLHDLPADFQLHYPDDGSPPRLMGDHFTANLHCYHHLVVIMHHRPQLQMLLEKRDPSFKTQLDICLASASHMCRIQEALYRDFGFHGLHFMTRGVNFTIYCVLTCTMLHLAAITSPDPVMNSQARLYFTRHMRVLEHCLASSTQEMQVQINALREAFSADTTQPFELKPTLGLRSPTMGDHPTPPSTNSGPTSAPIVSNRAWSNLDAASSKTLTPATEYGQPFDNVSAHGMTPRPAMPHHSSSYDLSTHSTYATPHMQPVTSAQQMGYTLEPVISNEQHTPVWDPSSIFNNWNTAFGGAQAPSQPSPPDPRTMQPTSAPMLPNQTSPINSHAMYGAQQLPVSANSVVPDAPPTMPTVTPVMWQDAFTSAYVSGHGQKRYREASVDHSTYGQYPNNKRRG